MPKTFLRLLLACAAILLSTTALADWPDKPIRMLVPFSAGGTVDVVARAAAAQLGRELKTSVVVDNVPGAGGTIATQRVATAAPDGYTLLFTTPNHTINPAVIAHLPFDSERDFTPVSMVAQIPELLVANAAQPFSDMKGFIAYAPAHPGELTYASAGNGTLPHVTMELMLQRLGLKLVHVPYKGAAPALNDLLGGQVAIKFDTIATSAPHIRSGRLKALAFAGPTRSPLMPDVPTVAESGAPGYEGVLWLGLLAPKGTPPEHVQTLYRAIARFSSEAAYRKQLQDAGVEVVAGEPAALGAQIHRELRQWAEVVKAANIKID